jgi:hypothetical protein
MANAKNYLDALLGFDLLETAGDAYYGIATSMDSYKQNH